MDKNDRSPLKGFKPVTQRKTTMAYSYVATKDGELAPAELTAEIRAKQSKDLEEQENNYRHPNARYVPSNPNDDVVHVLPEDDTFTLAIYGSVEELIKLLIEKDVEAWRSLPEKFRTFLLRSTEWQYLPNVKTGVPNLIINDVEVRWNGGSWVLENFHQEV